MTFSSDKTEVVTYVSDIIQNLNINSALTITITLEKSGVCSVNFVIDELLGDTEMQEYLKELQSILDEEQDG